MTWLPDHGWLVSEFCSRFGDYYSHVKAFHGCRPRDLTSYLQHGLRGQDRRHLHTEFRELFSDWPASDMDDAIRQFDARVNREQGKVWLLACDDELIRRCGHYLIQGSEYLMALAGTLGGQPAQRRLREVGIPTVIEVDLPMSFVSAEQRMEVARGILSEWGQIVAKRPLRMGNHPPCYVLDTSLPPQHIKGHFHPLSIPDPHGGYRPYLNLGRHCSACLTG